jgi:predicted exporter
MSILGSVRDMNEAQKVNLPSVYWYSLQSTQRGMCEDLLADAGYDPDEHADVMEAMAFAADLAAVDTAYEVMREHGLKPLADQADTL